MLLQVVLAIFVQWIVQISEKWILFLKYIILIFHRIEGNQILERNIKVIVMMKIDKYTNSNVIIPVANESQNNVK